MVHGPAAAVRALHDARVLPELRGGAVTSAPGASSPITIEVTAGLIQDAAGRYLITQRVPGSHLEGLWEFPGGKKEPGEDDAQALARELEEELGVQAVVGHEIAVVGSQGEAEARQLFLQRRGVDFVALGLAGSAYGHGIVPIGPADAAVISLLSRRAAPRA